MTAGNPLRHNPVEGSSLLGHLSLGLLVPASKQTISSYWKIWTALRSSKQGGPPEQLTGSMRNASHAVENLERAMEGFEIARNHKL